MIQTLPLNKRVKYARLARTTASELRSSAAFYTWRYTVQIMRKHATLIPLTALSICVLLLTSCGIKRVYEGPAKPRSDIAILMVIRPALPLAPRMFVDNVDRAVHRAELSMRKSIELIPGHHEINVGHAESFETCGLGFEAEGGKTYAVVLRETRTQWGAFLTLVEEPSNQAKKPIFKPGRDVECYFRRK